MINEDGKRVAVVGSRTFNDRDRLFKILTLNRAKIKLIVSGGANGADTLATEWATTYGVPYLVFPAAWHDPETGAYDKGAGFRRNHDIVKHSDVVLAFWDGESGGTAHTIEITQNAKKVLRIFKFEAPPKPVKEKKAQKAVTPVEPVEPPKEDKIVPREEEVTL